jgi:hypothetical protein
MAAPASTFIYVQLAALAALVFLLVAGSMILWQRSVVQGTTGGSGSGMLQWLAVPALVAAVAVYAVGTLIKRRAAHVSTTGRGRGEP